MVAQTCSFRDSCDPVNLNRPGRLSMARLIEDVFDGQSLMTPVIFSLSNLVSGLAVIIPNRGQQVVDVSCYLCSRKRFDRNSSLCEVPLRQNRVLLP